MTPLSHDPEINQCKQHLMFQVVFANASVIDLPESKLAFDGGLAVHRLYQGKSAEASSSWRWSACNPKNPTGVRWSSLASLNLGRGSILTAFSEVP